MTSPDDQGPPNWRAYLFFSLLTFFGTLFGGCVNRQFAKPGNEQILGKIEELRADINRERNRP